MTSPSARIGRFVRRAVVRGLRRLPAWRRAEAGLYRRLEAGFVQGRPGSAAWRVLLDVQLLREAFVDAGDYRVVDLNALTPDDEALLARLGTTAARLASLRCDRRLKQAAGGPRPKPPEVFDTAYQAQALQARALAFDSPFSGRPLASSRSLLCGPGHSIFYRYTDAGRSFWLAVGRESLGYQPVYLYLPDEQVVLLLGNRQWAWLGRWEIDQLRAFTVCHAARVLAYLHDPRPPVAVALADHHHFAHHLWNCLSGVQALVAAGAPFDRLAVTAEPMGPMDRLFPELPAERFAFLSDAELPMRALAGNWFLVRAGGLVVDDALVRRLHGVAAAAAPAALADAAALRERHWPILWASVRTGSRSWLSQAEGIAALATALQRDFPRLALVIDGFALPWLRRESDRVAWADAMVRDERAVVAALRARLDPAIPLRVNVGEPMAVSVVYSQVTDAYVATHGSLQNKIGWLGNTPGVVHGNRLVLSGIGAPLEDYCAFWSRANGVAPLYLDPLRVQDAAGSADPQDLRWANTADHYELAWPDLHALLRRALAGRDRPTR